MNGPVGMYKLRPIIDHNQTVKLPDSMYKLPNIHTAIDSKNCRDVVDNSTIQAPICVRNTDIIDQNNKNLPDMAALENKQQKILEQLSELKKQMYNIREQLKINSCNNNITIVKTVATTNLDGDTLKNNFENLPEIVVNANPKNPPYSLEVIQKLWQNHVHLTIKSYLHSTVTGLNENVLNFIRNLENFTPRTEQLPKIHVRLIWKNIGPHVELIVSRTPIMGEVNLLRFLSRSNLLNNYEKLKNLYEIDNLLDISYRLIQAETKTERTSLLQIINQSLGKSLWLCGCDQISIADIAVYSAIKQTINSNDINTNLSKWMERCVKC